LRLRAIEASLPPEELAIDGPYESVWDAIEDDLGEREKMKMLSTLMMLLEAHIRAQGWTQAKAAKQLGVTQPRVSDLLRGKINLFSIDSVVGMLGLAGFRLEVGTRTSPPAPKA
jgi:predicted XRE-type DNA-binding protein